MFRNSRSVWNVRAIPRRVISCGSRPSRLSPAKRMSPRVRRVDAGDEVEERRLAGAVRADHADDLALVDVQVELVDAREPAEALRDALQLEQPLGHQTISTRARAEQPLRARVHQHDQDHADQDQPRDARLGGEPRLPDERAEVERRDQQQVADDRPHGRQQRARARRARRTPSCRRRAGSSAAAPSARARRRACRRRSRRPRSRSARTPTSDRVHGEAERDRAGEHDREPAATAAASRRASPAISDVEDPRRVVRRAQHLERDVDDERAEDDAAEAAGAAEDQHRVDGDQQRHVEVGGEDGRVERGEERAGEPGDAGADAKATSFSRLTGHAHQLGRERVLAQRPPGAAGARLRRRGRRATSTTRKKTSAT